MARKSYAGAAVKTSLATGIGASGDTTVVLASATGWPTVSGGSTGFVIVVDPGYASEEKILCSARTGTSCTISTRGYDGSTATAHSAGAAVWHVLDANTVDESNDHTNTTSRDDHTQYLNTARHDIDSRHTFGAALPVPATPADVNTVGSAGTANGPARADHVHVLHSNVAGNALTLTSNILHVTPDNSTIEVSGDALQVKAGGIATSHLATGYRLTYVGATAPGSPAEGDLWYETDTDVLWVYNGTVWNSVMPQGWTSFTPNWENVTEGNGTNTGYYRLTGRSLQIRANLTFGSSTSVSGNIGLNTPNGETILGGANDLMAGSLFCYNVTATDYYAGICFGTGGSSLIHRFIASSLPAGYAGEGGTSSGVCTATVPFTWAASDRLTIAIDLPIT